MPSPQRFNLSILTLAIALLVALPGCERLSGHTVEERIQMAKDFAAKRDLKSSIIELKNALGKEPNNVQARLLLGQIYVETGEGPNAEKELRRARELGSSEESLRIPLGKALLFQQKFQQVLTEIQPGSSTSTRNLARILQIRGDALLGLDHLAEGCGLYKQARDADTKLVESYWGLARCAYANKDPVTARAQLQAAIKLEERNIGSWLLLGDIERMDNRPAEAEAAYAKALTIDPKHVAALASHALTAFVLGKDQLARRDVDALQKLVPDSPVVKYLQGMLLFLDGKYADARDALQLALKGNPEDMLSMLLLGMTQYKLQAYQQAEQHFSRVLAANPNNVKARKFLAASQIKINQPQEAKQTLEPLFGHGLDDAEVYALAGDATLAAGDPAQAVNLFQKAAELDPRSASARSGLGLSYLASQQADRAIDQFKMAAALDSTRTTSPELLFRTYLSKREYDKALAVVAELEGKHPGNVSVFNMKGAVLVAKGDRAGARKAFERALALAPDSVAVAMNLAQLDLMGNDPKTARNRLQRILEKEGGNVEAMLGMAKLATMTKQEKEALEWLERAAKANPKSLEPRLLLAQHYLRQGHPQKALILAREAQAAHPDNPLALEVLAGAQLAAGERENARVSYEKLAYLAPKSPWVKYKLAMTELALGRREQAKSALEATLRLKPDLMEALVALFSLQAQAGRHEEALKLAKQAQIQHPRSPVGHTLEGDLFMAQKRYAQAAKAYEAAQGLGRSATLTAQLHAAYSRAGRAKEAEAATMRWFKENPADTKVRVYLAQFYRDQGKDTLAIEEYQAILEKTPANPLALNELAWLYHQKKDTRALGYAEQAHKLVPDAANIMDTLGWILVEQGQQARGLDILKTAHSLAPGNPGIGYHYAVALARSGDRVQARKLLQALLSRRQPFPERAAAGNLLRELK